MKLKEIFKNILLEVSIEQLKQQFVDSGKIKNSTFDDIVSASSGKSAYATWLCKKVSEKLIKDEDVYKFENYFKLFEKNKNKYKYKDINQYKTKEDISNFIVTSVELKLEIEHDPSKNKGVSKQAKYKNLKIGEVEGFEVYKIPKGKTDLYNASCELGSGTEWCTATGHTSSYFDHYIKMDDLYIFIKGNEKYQFSYEAGQFMDKNDNQLDDYSGYLADFYIFLSEKENRPIPIEIKLKRNIPIEKNDDLTIQKNFHFNDITISNLPEGLHFLQNVFFHKCIIKNFPKNIKFKDTVTFVDSTIEKLSDNLDIHILNIINTKVNNFPNNLNVFDLYIVKSDIKNIPDSLKVTRDINIEKNFDLNKIPKHLKDKINILDFAVRGSRKSPSNKIPQN